MTQSVAAVEGVVAEIPAEKKMQGGLAENICPTAQRRHSQSQHQIPNVKVRIVHSHVMWHEK